MTKVPRASARADWTLEEGAALTAVFPIGPVPAGTTAWLTVRDEIGGAAILTLGPAAASLDGTLTVDCEAGLARASVPPMKTVRLAFPIDPDDVGGWRGHGVYDVVVYPAGDESKAVRVLEGTVFYWRRVTCPPGLE
jgi:hypothetical protein